MKSNEIKNLVFGVYEADMAPQAIELYIFDLDKSETKYTTAKSMILKKVDVHNYKMNLIDNTRKQKLLNLIEKSNIANWKDNYTDDLVYDGEAWNLTIEDVNGNKAEKYGLNDYPDEFEMFRNGLLDLFKEEYKYYNEGIIEFLANSENTQLQNMAANIYDSGKGIRNREGKKAVKLYENNLDKNNLKELANKYYEGKDVEKDNLKAFELFNEVANMQETYNNDNLSSLFIDYNVYYKIANMYDKGEGTQKNIDKAIEFFEKAIPYEKQAYKRLVEIYYEKKDYPLVLKYFIGINEKNAKLCDMIQRDTNTIYNSIKDVTKSLLSYEEIENMIFNIVIEQNKSIVYKTILKTIIYYNIAVESEKDSNLEICKKYIDDNEDIFETIEHGFPLQHPAKKNYTEISYIPFEKLGNTLKQIACAIDKYVKNGNNKNLLDITSDRNVDEYIERILKYI
ncbi:MAG: sel1 repeat family protein [Clostridia bacterium]|nr:sel1 repeat family protein [Clostridia bacterium]